MERPNSTNTTSKESGMCHLLSNDGDFWETSGQWCTNALLCQSVCQRLQVIGSGLCTDTREYITELNKQDVRGYLHFSFWFKLNPDLFHDAEFSTVKDLPHDGPGPFGHRVARGHQPHEHSRTSRHRWDGRTSVNTIQKTKSPTSNFNDHAPPSASGKHLHFGLTVGS